ncbi:MAG TPA: MIP/aquaporin family protein, partial [Usitatibacter sp.]|nr:MIP/aquaporin family protein [Usitatibacter sp.]
MNAPLPRRLAAEAIGTALLLAVIIGSGIMGERLAGGIAAIALLANSVATGCALAVLIAVLGPISGAHFNPAVTLASALEREIAWRDVFPYIVVQVTGAFVGVAAAHLMFAEPLFSASIKIRAGPPQWFSEGLATFGLLLVILGCTLQGIKALP